jgi:hypothetical protein
VAGEPCDQCDGAGIWAGGCEQVIDCWQCHGTGVQRVRGNCDACLGWGWAYGAVPCTACKETGWIAEPVALYRCAECSRTIRAADVEPECSINVTHRLSRVSAPSDQRPR